MEHPDFLPEVEAYLKAHPDTLGFEAFVTPIAGPPKGKWQSIDALAGLAKGAMRLPHSAATMQVWSEDIEGLPLVYHQGDPDAICAPIPGSLVPVPWANPPTAQVQLQPLDAHTGAPSPYAPRSVLLRQVERLAERGLKAQVACELEFHLLDAETLHETGRPQPPRAENGERLNQSQTYDLDANAKLSGFLEQVRLTCEAQKVPLKAMGGEAGPGQMELNLTHVADPLLAADQAMRFKRLVKGIARQRGMEASFMAKPYWDSPGNGLHVHLSLLDADRQNIFAATEENAPNRALRQAIAGQLALLPDFQAVFAPHANSYRRYNVGWLVPVHASWGFDHRSVAVRVPSTLGGAARFEHRVAGADANPYLVLAALIAGALHGMDQALDLPEPILTSDDLAKLSQLNRRWEPAVDAFEASPLARDAFGNEFHATFVAGRREEIQRFDSTLTQLEHDLYLTRV